MKNQKKNKEVSLPEESFEALMRTAAIKSLELYSNILPRELTPSRFAVLKALYLKLKGSMSQTGLAQEIVKTTGNMTTVIDNLEKKALVERVRGMKDRRYYNIILTPKGRKLIKKLYPVYVERVGNVMGKLTNKQNEGFKRLCVKLGQQL